MRGRPLSPCGYNGRGLLIMLKIPSPNTPINGIEIKMIAIPAKTSITPMGIFDFEGLISVGDGGATGEVSTLFILGLTLDGEFCRDCPCHARRLLSMVIIIFLLDITIFSGDNFPCEMQHFRAIIGGVFMRKKYLLCFVLRGNANSMEALTAKGAALDSMYKKQQEKVSTLEAALRNAQRAQEEYSSRVSTAQSNIERPAFFVSFPYLSMEFAHPSALALASLKYPLFFPISPWGHWPRRPIKPSRRVWIRHEFGKALSGLILQNPGHVGAVLCQLVKHSAEVRRRNRIFGTV